MYLAPKSISAHSLEKEALRVDKVTADHFEDCGLGKQAVYLDAFGVFSRMRYVPLKRVDRVYKRLAVSKGFFQEGKIFGTIPYLVVHFDGSKQKVVRFRNEEAVDAMLQAFREQTKVPVGKE